MTQTKSLTYRQGTLKDLHALIQLAQNSYSEFSQVLSSENWQKMHDFLHNEMAFTTLVEKAVVFVSENEEKEIVGMAYLMPSGNPTAIYQANWCYIRMVGVHPAYRGYGIAKALTQMCINEARTTGEKTIGLHTSEFMDSARHIYESMGFIQTKELEPIYGKKYWLYLLQLDQ
jgi:ribosomal protein S18 acetylase RimI-like enzyme